MNTESLLTLLLLFTPFAIAFFIEALVIFFFKLKPFWASLGISILINLVSFALIYFLSSYVLSKMGYVDNGLQFEVQVVFFLCWVSIIADALMLRLFARNQEKKRVFMASIVMNILSYLFFYFFIINSHQDWL